MKKCIWIIAILITPLLLGAQTTNGDNIKVTANIKAGALLQNYPFELPGFNNTLSSPDAKSNGFLVGADIIFKKKWLGMITSLYGRSCGADESFYLETFELNSFNSDNFFSFGVLTGLYCEIPVSDGVFSSVYAKLQAGGMRVYFPDQEFVFTDSYLNSLQIENKVSAGFVSNIGLGGRFKIGEKTALVLDLNMMRETADVAVSEIWDYKDIDTITERVDEVIEWNQVLLNPNIGFSLTF